MIWFSLRMRSVIADLFMLVSAACFVLLVNLFSSFCSASFRCPFIPTPKFLPVSPTYTLSQLSHGMWYTTSLASSISILSLLFYLLDVPLSFWWSGKVSWLFLLHIYCKFVHMLQTTPYIWYYYLHIQAVTWYHSFLSLFTFIHFSLNHFETPVWNDNTFQICSTSLFRPSSSVTMFSHLSNDVLINTDFVRQRMVRVKI